MDGLESILSITDSTGSMTHANAYQILNIPEEAITLGVIVASGLAVYYSVNVSRKGAEIYRGVRDFCKSFGSN